jgi:hypothetical protein
MSNDKHTPIPWGINKYGGIGAGEFFITPTIIESTGWSEDDCSADMQFIITAVNAHDELIRALKALMPQGWDDGTMDHMPGIKQARTIFAKVKAIGRQNHARPTS